MRAEGMSAARSPLSTKSPTTRRILREAAEISSAPSPDYAAEPLESDLFEWHFTVRGPPNSPYSEGLYHGRIVLPPSYPLRPPSFRFTTPNGRFETNREICLSISGHHEETWQPAWGLRTAIVALRSFMETNAQDQVGGLDTPESYRRRLAEESPSFKCATCDRSNADIIRESEERAKQSSDPGEIPQTQVPAELRMGWRDELEENRQVSDTIRNNEPHHRNRSEEADLAEGFVQTMSETTTAQMVPTCLVSPEQVQTQRHQHQMTPTPTLPLPQGGAAREASRQTGLAYASGSPLWLDRLIVAMIILLAALMTKVLFAS